jgi:hypothetical protein
MIGVCITVISVVRVVEATHDVSTIIDKVGPRPRPKASRELRRLRIMIALGVLALAGVMVAAGDCASASSSAIT